MASITLAPSSFPKTYALFPLRLLPTNSVLQFLFFGFIIFFLPPLRIHILQKTKTSELFLSFHFFFRKNGLLVGKESQAYFTKLPSTALKFHTPGYFLVAEQTFQVIFWTLISLYYLNLNSPSGYRTYSGL